MKSLSACIEAQKKNESSEEALIDRSAKVGIRKLSLAVKKSQKAKKKIEERRAHASVAHSSSLAPGAENLGRTTER